MKEETLREYATRALQKFEEEVKDDPGIYMDSDGEFSIEVGDVERFIEEVLEGEGIEEWGFELIEEILQYVNEKEIEEIEDEVLEQLRDAEEYRRDPLGYHGMSQKDFL